MPYLPASGTLPLIWITKTNVQEGLELDTGNQKRSSATFEKVFYLSEICLIGSLEMDICGAMKE